MSTGNLVATSLTASRRAETPPQARGTELVHPCPCLSVLCRC